MNRAPLYPILVSPLQGWSFANANSQGVVSRPNPGHPEPSTATSLGWLVAGPLALSEIAAQFNRLPVRIHGAARAPTARNKPAQRGGGRGLRVARIWARNNALGNRSKMVQPQRGATTRVMSGVAHHRFSHLTGGPLT